MHRVGARPASVARLAIARKQGERSGRDRLALESEGFLQPGFQRMRLRARFAAAREQQLEGGCARARGFGKQTGNDQYAVHAWSFMVRTPFLPRCRARIL